MRCSALASIPQPSPRTGKAPKLDPLQQKDLKIAVLTADAEKHPNMRPLNLPAAEDGADPSASSHARQPLRGLYDPKSSQLTPPFEIPLPHATKATRTRPDVGAMWVQAGRGGGIQAAHGVQAARRQGVNLPLPPARCSVLGWALSILFWFGGIKALAASSAASQNNSASYGNYRALVPGSRSRWLLGPAVLCRGLITLLPARGEGDRGASGTSGTSRAAPASLSVTVAPLASSPSQEKYSPLHPPRLRLLPS